MKQLEDEIIYYLEQFLTVQYGENYEYSISNYETIEIFAINKTDTRDRFCMIRIGISKENQQIYIPNVFIPTDLKYSGIGKKLIFIVYNVGKKNNYDLFVVHLTDSFREKLLKRGAVTTDVFDTLYIDENTKLL